MPDDPRYQPGAGPGATRRGRFSSWLDTPAAAGIDAEREWRDAARAQSATGAWVQQPGAWPSAGAWSSQPGAWPPSPAGWQQPAPWGGPVPAGSAQWQAPGAWQAPGQTPPAGAWPQPCAWPQPGQLPGPASAAAMPGPAPLAPDGRPAWIPDDIPWGWSRPPAVQPVLLPPGRFHPRSRARGIFSISGRVSPRLYLAGLALGIPGLIALAWINVAPWFGVDGVGIAGLPGWAVAEIGSWLAVGGFVAAAVAQGRQRRAEGWHDYAGPSPLLTIAPLLGLITGLGLPLFAVLDAAGVALDSATGTLVVVSMYFGCYAALVHFLAVRPGALTWHDVIRPAHLAPDRDDWAMSVPWSPLGNRAAWLARSLRARIGRGIPGDLLFGAAMAPLAVIASSVTNIVLIFVLGLNSSDISQPGPAAPTGIDLWITLLALSVLVPMGEETFFRGFATNAWGRSLGRNRALVIAGLFFAAAHVINVTATVPDVALRAAIFNFGARVPVALALGWVYMRRRSIFASGALHATYNGLIVLLALSVS
jgi:membrane protease YdiL (CAAX protease family)